MILLELRNMLILIPVLLRPGYLLERGQYCPSLLFDSLRGQAIDSHRINRLKLWYSCPIYGWILITCDVLLSLNDINKSLKFLKKCTQRDSKWLNGLPGMIPCWMSMLFLAYITYHYRPWYHKLNVIISWLSSRWKFTSTDGSRQEPRRNWWY